MLIKDNKAISDQEIATEFINFMEKEYEECRLIAENYLRSINRTKHYRVEYIAGPLTNTIYCPLTDEEIAEIRALINDSKEDDEPLTDELVRKIIESSSESLSIDWHKYIIEDDYCWVSEEPRITMIDLNDSKYFYFFGVWHHSAKMDDEFIHKDNLLASMSDDEFIQLVACKMMNPLLSFNDLRNDEMMPELFKRLDKEFEWCHYNKMVIMTDIEKVVVALNHTPVNESLKGEIAVAAALTYIRNHPGNVVFHDEFIRKNYSNLLA